MGAPPHTPHSTPLCHPPQGHIAFQPPALALLKSPYTNLKSLPIILFTPPSYNFWHEDEPSALPPSWFTPHCTLTARPTAARNHLAVTRGQVAAIRINATRCSPNLAPTCVPPWPQFMQTKDGPNPWYFALALLGAPNSTTPLRLQKAVQHLLKLVVYGL